MASRRTAQPVQAVIFDLDGVLVDTEPLHLAAARALVAPGEIDDETYSSFIGGSNLEYRDWLEHTYGLKRGAFEARYSGHFFEQLESLGLRPLDGVTQLLDALAQRGIPTAVASQSTREWVRATLEASGLATRFGLLVSAEEIGADKPAPDIYLRTAERLGVPTEACIAIEDSIFGVRSALDAGMTVIQSRQSGFPFPPQPGAHAVIASLRDFDLGWLDARPRG